METTVELLMSPRGFRSLCSGCWCSTFLSERKSSEDSQLGDIPTMGVEKASCGACSGGSSFPELKRRACTELTKTEK